jgi:hypothetical protein
VAGGAALLTLVSGSQGPGGLGEGSGKSRKSGGGGAAGRENGYAKLEGTKVTRVLQTVCITLGRDCMASKRKAPEGPDEQQSPEEAQREKRRDRTFLAVGQDSSISRRHVELVFDFHKRRWALMCLGRNGVYVDNAFISQVPASEDSLLHTSCCCTASTGAATCFLFLPRRAQLLLACSLAPADPRRT